MKEVAAEIASADLGTDRGEGHNMFKAGVDDLCNGCEVQEEVSCNSDLADEGNNYWGESLKKEVTEGNNYEGGNLEGAAETGNTDMDNDMGEGHRMFKSVVVEPCNGCEFSKVQEEVSCNSYLAEDVINNDDENWFEEAAEAVNPDLSTDTGEGYRTVENKGVELRNGCKHSEVQEAASCTSDLTEEVTKWIVQVLVGVRCGAETPAGLEFFGGNRDEQLIDAAFVGLS